MTAEPADPRRSLAAARSMLFVPGNRPDRFGKAVAAGAGAVIVDLEDAVAAAGKDGARGHVAAWLDGGAAGGTGGGAVAGARDAGTGGDDGPGGDEAPGGVVVVRINPPGTPWFDADLGLARAYGLPVMLPKAEDPGAVADVTARTGGRCPLLPLVETPVGIERAAGLCGAPGVVRAVFGNIDLATLLGVRHDDRPALGYARSRLVLASAAAGIAAPVDGVTTDLTAADVLAADVAHARRLGFGGKLCVHPRQVPAVRDGFAPTEEELRWARRVLAAGDGVSAVDGQMVDRPVLERARRLLDLQR